MIWLFIDSRGPGGAERHIATLAQSLRDRGLYPRVVLWADYGRNLWRDQLEKLRLDVRVLDGTVSGLIKALRDDDPNLIHTHGYKAGITGRIGGLLSGIPTVSTFHSGEREPFPVNLYSSMDEWTSFLSVRIAVSEGIANRLPFPAIQAPNYIHTRSAPPTGPLPRRVAFVGRLSAEKGPDLFCELARRCAPGLEWHVYGDGPMRAALERQHGANIRFHGMVSDLSKVWPTIGLLVQPSRSEGLPLTPLEAMTEGIPVLASRVGGIPSIVIPGRNGWLFESGDLTAATEAIDIWRSLPRDDEAQMRRSCWEYVELHFSEKRRLPDILSAYDKAGIGTRGQRPGVASPDNRAFKRRVF